MKAQILTHEKLQDMAADCLDETQPMVNLAGVEYCPSRLLRDSDPVAWREFKNNYYDALWREGYRLDEDCDWYFVCPECGDAWTEADEAAACCGVRALERCGKGE